LIFIIFKTINNFYLSDFDHVIIDDEKKKFYDAIGYKDNQQLSIYPEEVYIIYIDI
jgi:predicted lactoylglutathione lyase